MRVDEGGQLRLGVSRDTGSQIPHEDRGRFGSERGQADILFAHVSVGSLFGIGLTTGKANIPMVSAIVLSWVVTLPCATIAAGATYWILKSLIS